MFDQYHCHHRQHEMFDCGPQRFRCRRWFVSFVLIFRVRSLLQDPSNHAERIKVSSVHPNFANGLIPRSVAIEFLKRQQQLSRKKTLLLEADVRCESKDRHGDTPSVVFDDGGVNALDSDEEESAMIEPLELEIEHEGDEEEPEEDNAPENEAAEQMHDYLASVPSDAARDASQSTLDIVLDTLASSFNLTIPECEDNAPMQLLRSLTSMLFRLERAHWQYADACCVADPSLPRLTMRQFAVKMFPRLPRLASLVVEPQTSSKSSRGHVAAVDALLRHFYRIKTGTRTCGVIILNPSMTRCLLVRGFGSSSSYGWPKGKVEPGESDLACAAREAREETGLDIASLLHEQDSVSLRMSFRFGGGLSTRSTLRLFIATGVPDETPLAPVAEHEIAGLAWFPIDTLPSGPDQWCRARGATFRLVAPVVNTLREWIHRRRRTGTRTKKLASKAAAHGAAAAARVMSAGLGSAHRAEAESAAAVAHAEHMTPMPESPKAAGVGSPRSPRRSARRPAAGQEKGVPTQRSRSSPPWASASSNASWERHKRPRAAPPTASMAEAVAGDEAGEAFTHDTAAPSFYNGDSNPKQPWPLLRGQRLLDDRGTGSVGPHRASPLSSAAAARGRPWWAAGSPRPHPAAAVGSGYGRGRNGGDGGGGGSSGGEGWGSPSPEALPPPGPPSGALIMWNGAAGPVSAGEAGAGPWQNGHWGSPPYAAGSNMAWGMLPADLDPAAAVGGGCAATGDVAAGGYEGSVGGGEVGWWDPGSPPAGPAGVRRGDEERPYGRWVPVDLSRLF